jgi:hypothetical protein
MFLIRTSGFNFFFEKKTRFSHDFTNMFMTLDKYRLLYNEMVSKIVDPFVE